MKLTHTRRPLRRLSIHATLYKFEFCGHQNNSGVSRVRFIARVGHKSVETITLWIPVTGVFAAKPNRRIIMTKWILAAALALPFVAGPAFAKDDDDAKADKAAARAAKMFKKLDTDSNGKVTLAEFKALAKGDDAKEAKLEKKFKKLDADGNDSLSKEELAKGSKKKPKKKKEDGDGDKKTKGDDADK